MTPSRLPEEVLLNFEEPPIAEEAPLATLQPEDVSRHEPIVPQPESIRSHAAQSTTSPVEGAGRSHSGDVDTGFLQIYGPENQFDAEQQEFVANLETRHGDSDPRQQELQQSFSETYFEFCYTWCPVLDRTTLSGDMARSPMLANSLALAATHIQPPLLPHCKAPAEYYDKARTIFYNDEEPDSLTTLKSLALFYWWAPRPPSLPHRHSSWWWTSVIIRHAQQMNIHREPGEHHQHKDQLDLSLRRRIWWTVFVSLAPHMSFQRAN